MSETREATASFHAIGEVLTLLRGEFPDITISKIRFLESQGLLEPERTAAGYRRFYAHDIARLRWILRQQREHFLPLKVIKSRLRESDRAADTEGRAHGAPDTDMADPPSNLQLPLDTPGVGARAAVQRAGTPAFASTPGSTTNASAATPAPEAPSEGPDRALTSSPGVPTASIVVDTIETIETIETFTVSLDGAIPIVDAAPPITVVRRPATTTSSSAAESAPRILPEPAIFASRRASEPTGAVAAPRAAPAAAPAPSPRAKPAVVATELTLAELCEAADLDAATVRELERYDLLPSRESGSTGQYDAHALAVCRTAAVLINEGIEVRHLRMFVVALERELSLFDQLLLPERRGRGDDALHARHVRRQALVREGERLRAALLDRMLHDET
jgi:DNA-binding transcriptional MerR regulator